MKILLAAVLFMYCCTLHAQSANPNVLNVTGRTATAKNVQLTWSVGEIAIATLPTPNIIITEGFLQPDMSSVSAIEQITVSSNISVYPNPVHSQLYIKQTEDVIGSIFIINALGERVYEGKFNDGIVDMSVYHPGFYFINITSHDGGDVHTFKIIKY